MLRPRKFWSQHFLIDERVAIEMVNTIAARGYETVLEIGPGRGALTGLLARKFARMIAVERDHDLVVYLRAKFPPTVEIVENDILHTDIPKLLAQRGLERIPVIGNLPYHITTPILFALAEIPHVVPWALVMVQREVAARMVALPGCKDYSLLTINIQRAAKVTRVREVPAESFDPVPKVESTIVALDFTVRPEVPVDDEGLFQRIVRAMFAQRRKMIRNTLVGAFPGRFSNAELADLLQSVDIKPTQRPEEIPWVQFVALANTVLKVCPAVATPERPPRKPKTAEESASD